MPQNPGPERPADGRTERPADSRSGQPADGRTERGRMTREKIADAVLSLLDEGLVQFPAERVAERAGVSRRLVFHHFADMVQLTDTAVTRRIDQLLSQIKPLPTDGPRELRVAALAEQRGRILEWLTPTRLAMMRLENPSERVQEAVQMMLDYGRTRISEIFAQELDRLPAARRTDLLNALDAATTWSTWHHWRSAGLDVDAARRTMATAVLALLAATDHPETIPDPPDEPPVTREDAAPGNGAPAPDY